MRFTEPSLSCSALGTFPTQCKKYIIKKNKKRKNKKASKTKTFDAAAFNCKCIFEDLFFHGLVPPLLFSSLLWCLLFSKICINFDFACERKEQKEQKRARTKTENKNFTKFVCEFQRLRDGVEVFT